MIAFTHSVLTLNWWVRHEFPFNLKIWAIFHLGISKDWGPKKVTIYFPIFYLVKSSENILFFYLHFTWLYGLWNYQRISKKIAIEWVLIPQNETSSPIFKTTIFSKFFGNFMSHIIRLNAGKRIKHFLNFSLNRK